MSERKLDSLWLVVVVGGFAVLLIGWPWAPSMLGMGMMGFGWGFMFLIPLAFLVLVGIGVYYLFKELTKSKESFRNSPKRTLEILNERYAKGDITRDQYLRMKEELGL